MLQTSIKIEFEEISRYLLNWGLKMESAMGVFVVPPSEGDSEALS